MATYSLLASTKTTGTISGPATTPSIDTTGATLLVVLANVVGTSTPTISDSASNSWGTVTNSTTYRSVKISFWVIRAPTTSGTHTFTVGGTNIYGSISVLAFSGDVPVSDFISTVSTTQTGSDTTTILSTSSITPTEDNALVIASISSGGSSFAVDGGFTLAQEQPGIASVSYPGASAYKVQTTAAAAQTQFSWTGTAGAAAAIFWIKSAHSGGGGSSAGAAAHYYRQMQ